jgi:eukaryotic-like serine/threonine-protein kinase
MSLAPGVLVGNYEVVSLLGAGGMGEVYRARDTRLQRDVALKILPDVFANDRERLARFEREAQVLASLNHPHIAAIYGVEHREGLQALVLELVEGPTLADRIAQGPMPLDEALPIARQIAEALEAAHEHGVIHRDLKPANVKLRPDGAVKVLDFGLAKAGAASATSSAGGALPDYPTITSPAMMTGAGVILGTAAYMSPEQAKGKVADRRSDVWAFGCVLFEMLTGTRAFEGEDVSDTLASVLRAEPKWSALATDTPDAIRRLLRRSLEKDRSRRLSDIAVARLEIDEALTTSAISREPPAGAAVVQQRPWWKHAIPVALTAILAGALGATTGWMLKPTPQVAVSRSRFILPEQQRFTSFLRQLLAISPDGTQMAYIADNRLYLRPMSDLDPKPIAGSENLRGNVSNPVFSPDGTAIAFFSFMAGGSGTLQRIATTGGSTVTIAQVGSTNHGMSWERSGIVVGEGAGGIRRLSPDGGQPEIIVNAKSGEELAFPEMLPDDHTVLFTAVTGSTADRWGSAQIVAQRVGSSDRKTLVEGGSHAHYVESGHLVYALGGTLLAVPFDWRRLVVTGAATPVVEGVWRGPLSGAAFFSISDTGSLIFVPGPAGYTSLSRNKLVLIDRQGQIEALNLSPGAYTTPRVSPDGRQVAFAIEDGQQSDIWIYNLSGTNPMLRLTFGGRSRYPIWSADSQRVAFQSDREGDLGIFWQRADSPGAAERLTKAEPGTSHLPESWSPIGDRFSFSTIGKDGASLWMFSLPDKKAAAFGDARSSFPLNSDFSPDGRWIAYTFRTPGGGESNVFVEPVPPTGAKFQITRDNSHHPVWSSPDSRELSYRVGAGQHVIVPITAQPGFIVGNPVTLPGEYAAIPFGSAANYDVMPDGKRFLVAAPATMNELGTSFREIYVVLNWHEELKWRVPANR